MNEKWQVNEAKSRFSELIEQADAKGPQIITRHGRDRAVVLSVKDFRKLEAAKPDFKEYLLAGPKIDGLDIDRPEDIGRDIDL